MAVDNARSLALIRKLDQVLAKTHAKPLPERVHLIRTTSRRLEALLDTLVEDPDRGQRKLRKRLKRLRRGAGGVRDIDVQIVALRKLKIGREQERKARLMQALNEKRSERERELVKALNHKSVQKVRNGLRRWSAEISSARPADRATDSPKGRPTDRPKDQFDAINTALRQFSTLARQVRSLTPENLHAYRTRCKRIRYVAEMAGSAPAAKTVVAQLKRSQDAVGDWHDWQTLTQTAESLFSRSMDSALVAALRNVTNAKFVEARSVCLESRRNLLAQYRAMLTEKRARVPRSQGVPRSGPGLARPGVSRTSKPQPPGAPPRRKRVARKKTVEPPAAPAPAQEPEPPAAKAASAVTNGAASSVA